MPNKNRDTIKITYSCVRDIDYNQTQYQIF